MTDHMATTQVVKRPGTSENRLLNQNRQGPLSKLSFADSDCGRYFESACPREVTDIVESRRRNVNCNRKRPA